MQKYEKVLEHIVKKLEGIARNTWWENKCLAIILFSKIIRGIVRSDRYQNLVKNPSANQKFFRFAQFI